MKKSFISILLCAAILISGMTFSVSAESGTVYYIDSASGDDENSGTAPDSAWRTLAKAESLTYSAGDKILFKAGGIYTGAFTAKGNGTAENPITISSYGDIEKDGLPMFYSNKDVTLITIENVSGWRVENLEISAPNGKGIWILAKDNKGTISDIAVTNCIFHNIRNTPVTSLPIEYSPIYVASYGKDSKIVNLTLSKIDIYDCGRGISSFGTAIEWHRDIFVSPEVSYNRNYVFEDITMNNILYDGLIIRSVYGMVVRNCAFINTATREDWPTAALWCAGSKNLLIEHCEVAGSTNYKDGMAVDFDGWSTDSTYQYIYSHDNVRFVNNCIYDNQTKNANCTVRYCLSVNDNKSDNNLGQLLSSSAYDYTINDDKSQYMDNFKFYNNTIINGGDFRMYHIRNSYIANNIFWSEDVMQTFQTLRFENDDLTKYEFTGEFTNNCFYGCAIPITAKNSILLDPQFVGTDLTDKNSFKLSVNSPLLGKGIKVEDDMGERDFYGNPLSDTHNIGCYEGIGENTENVKSGLSYITDFFRMLLGYLVSAVKNLIEIM